MPRNLLASACPAIQQGTGFLGLAASKIASNAVVAEAAQVSPIDFVSNTLQPHARRLDDAFSFGGANACAILSGSNNGNELALSISATPLLLKITKGKGICAAEVELAEDYLLSVPDNTTRVWIWLQQNGVPTKTLDLTAPSTLSILLGNCSTAGGVITSLDTSGVLYVHGGQLIRYSADPGIPTDTPPANLLFRQETAFGSFDWNGTAYLQANIPDVTGDPTAVAEGLWWFRRDTQQIMIYSGGAAIPFNSTGGGGSGIPATSVTDVASTSNVGTSASYARGDHSHKGLHSVSDGTNTIFGDLLLAGAGFSISGNTLTIPGGSGSPTGAASGDLAGSYPSPVLAAILSGGTVGDATHVPQLTIDNKGRVTAFSSIPITFPAVPAPATTVNDVAATSSVGSSTKYAKEDHSHQGVHGLNTLKGDVTLSAGTGISLTTAGNNIAIAATGTGGVSIQRIALSIPPVSWIMPSGLTEFGGVKSYRNKFDLSGCSMARIVASANSAFPGSVSPLLAVQWSTNQTTWNYLNVSASAPFLSSFGPGANDGSFASIDAGAQNDVYLRIVGSGGDGTTTVNFGMIYLEVM